MIIADMHCDTISKLFVAQQKNEPVSLFENALHVDLKRMKKSCYLLQTFALFCNIRGEASLLHKEDFRPFEETIRMLELYYRVLEERKDMILPVTTYEEIERNLAEGKMSALLSVEDGGTCQGEIALLRTFYQLGVRMMTLTWNYPNELGVPNVSMDRLREGKTPPEILLKTPDVKGGLTETGFAFLEEMERIGMMIDVSHLSDAGFYDVVSHVHKPVVASHSNARAVCGAARNLTDDMIRKLAEHGGVTGLNFCPDFLAGPEIGDNGKTGTIMAIVEHAKHITNTGGIGCLGLGTDFDGIDGHGELPDCGYMERLVDSLKKGGFTASDTDKICFDNVMRVYKEWLSA